MSEKSLSELLSIIEEAEVKKTKEVKSRDIGSVNRFISELNIKTGLDRIPTHVIFYHYKRKWSDPHKLKKVNKIVFFRSFNKLFTQTRTGKQRYYLLNSESFDLSRETLLEAEYFDQRLKSGKKEKKR